jgi:7-carboxy-7-deazaguanine synthase
MVYKAGRTQGETVYADVIEVFSSAQGEGIYLGTRQTFVRFAGCNLSCRFCDTTRQSQEHCRLETEAGSGDFETKENPLTTADLLSAVERLTPKGGVVSLTGGEPLIHAAFLEKFLPVLKDSGYRTYLETNGTLHAELQKGLKYLDCVAMDIKLPSATGEEDLFESHARFLTLAKATNVFVKAVITGNTLEKEVMQCADIVAAVDPSIPLILQPVTPVDEQTLPPSQQFLMSLQSSCSKVLRDVRIIPQCHKIVGLS